MGASTRHETGNFTLVIDEINLDILSFSIDLKHISINNNGTDTTTSFWEIEVIDIPFKYKNSFTLRQFEDNNAMSHITKYEFRTYHVTESTKSEQRILKLENNNETNIEFYWTSTP